VWVSVSKQYVVVGAGVTGIVAAFLLAKRGHEVTLLENRPEIGGVNSGLAWNGFSLDFGCHLFSNDSDVSTGVLLELLEGEASPVDVRFASVLGGEQTSGFELPNLASLGPAVADRILRELLEACATPARSAETLRDLLENRYGPTAAIALDGCLRKVFRDGAEALAPEAIAATTFRRVRVVPDQVARLLKQLAVVDDRLAQGSASDPMCFYRDKVALYPHRSFYPKSGGMGGFASRARRVLERLGVRIHTGVTLRALSLKPRAKVITDAHGEFEPEAIVWTLGLGRLEPWLGGTNNIAASTVAVPMLLYYFAIEKEQETGMSYVNDFDLSTRVFRASVPGAYGSGNCPPGQSYVCCEVPVNVAESSWQNPEQFEAEVWNEVLKLGVATGQPLRAFAVKARESYKAPRADYFAKSRDLRAKLELEPQILTSREWSFSVGRTIVELTEHLKESFAA
jgi:phytoene dehydrogenase-like protein